MKAIAALPEMDFLLLISKQKQRNLSFLAEITKGKSEVFIQLDCHSSYPGAIGNQYLVMLLS